MWEQSCTASVCHFCVPTKTTSAELLFPKQSSNRRCSLEYEGHCQMMIIMQEQSCSASVLPTKTTGSLRLGSSAQNIPLKEAVLQLSMWLGFSVLICLKREVDFSQSNWNWNLPNLSPRLGCKSCWGWKGTKRAKYHPCPAIVMMVQQHDCGSSDNAIVWQRQENSGAWKQRLHQGHAAEHAGIENNYDPNAVNFNFDAEYS